MHDKNVKILGLFKKRLSFLGYAESSTTTERYLHVSNQTLLEAAI